MGLLVLLACSTLTFFLASTLVDTATWTLTTNTSGASFYDDFNFSTGQGVVNSSARYLSQQDAMEQNLVLVDDAGNFIMRVDNTTVGGNDRASVRIESKEVYGDGLYIIDIDHSPLGCGTWPAFWTRPQSSSYQEIDIIENINNLYSNPLSVLHTESQCTLANETLVQETGQLGSLDCSNSNPEHTGCLTSLNISSNAPIWGSDYNQLGGGVYAMERDLNGSKTIQVWTWPRSNVPTEITNGSTSLDTSQWGVPAGLFLLPSSSCQEVWASHMIVLNIALCGDWAEATYTESNCAAMFSTCSNQISSQPSTFTESFWSIKSLQVYTNGTGQNSSSSSANATSGNSHSDSMTDSTTKMDATLHSFGFYNLTFFILLLHGLITFVMVN